ncbi:hypothetical protein LDENG_00086840 [Lucifuga dentata]|nr:hypothetical protein LDENG_00086840 [Lucifuga dentata]
MFAAAMASRLTLNTQLSSIMETMAKSALVEICKLVEQNSSELLQEMSRLMEANSALTDKINHLECELTVVRSDAAKLSKSRSVGVQTAGSEEREDGQVTGAPTIEGIFGQDWCVDLWKESVEGVTYCPQSSSKISDHITVTEIKEEEDVEDAVSSCLQETVSTEEHEESTAPEPEHASIDYSIDDGTCSLLFNQEKEAGDLDAEMYSSHIIPIEEDEDEDVQFVQESHQESSMNARGEPSQNKQQTLPTYSETFTIDDTDVQDDLNAFSVQHKKRDKFTCEICSRTFFHKGTLTQHMKSHKSNYCSICKQHLPQRSKIKAHTCVPPLPSKRIRSSCELCGKTFANPSALTIHYVVHTGEKPHRCNFCGKGFTQKGNLKCHLRIHTEFTNTLTPHQFSQ